jgi:hypothetical protein
VTAEGNREKGGELEAREKQGRGERGPPTGDVGARGRGSSSSTSMSPDAVTLGGGTRQNRPTVVYYTNCTTT